jgi:hypothetical protein
MNQGCLSDLALEEYLLKPEGTAVPPHVVGCKECQARLDGMREQGAVFRTSVYPQTIEDVLARHGGLLARWRWQWTAFAGAVAVPAAAAAVLVLRPAAPDQIPTSGTQIKGSVPAPAPSSGVPFSVYVAAADGARKVADGAQVPADGQLRFRVDQAERCWFAVLSVDGSGQVSQLYPGGQTGVELPQAALPGGAVLDGQAGPERLFALCSREPLPLSGIEEQARAGIQKAGASVRTMTRLPGVPESVLQSTMLIEKAP